jgi:DNA-binding NarL/FixJ family response regulator
MIRVAIAEDHPEMRVALRLLLKLSSDMKLVAEMSNGLEAVVCIKEFQPDVLVMDVRMPGLDGLKATRKIMELAVRTRVVLVSSQRGSSIAMEAIEAGAQGFVPKEEVAAFLLLAIETVHRGETFFAP